MDSRREPNTQESSGTATVLIVDDCMLFRENLAAVLNAIGITVAGLAWDLPSLVTALREVDGSLILLNTAGPGNLRLLQAATDMRPDVPVVVFGTSEEDEPAMIVCAEVGVAGYHLRCDSLSDLVLLIREVSAGRSFLPPRVSAILLRRLSLLASQRQWTGRDLVLTTRESQILTMLEVGWSNRDIAAQLDIAVHTVKNHVHNLLTKLGVSTRAEAAARSRSMN